MKKDRRSGGWVFAGLAAAALLAAGGCGSKAAKLAPVRGRVFYKGGALSGGTVVFAPDPDRGGRGPLARGEIQTDGSYALLTGAEPGAVPGCHRVTVLAVEVRAAPAGQRFAEPRPLLPLKYSDPELSGLAREVKAGRDNEFDLLLD